MIDKGRPWSKKKSSRVRSVAQDIGELKPNIRQGVCGKFFWSEFFPWSDLWKRLRNAFKN